MKWLLVTEANEDVGLGHLSRMCGLAQALEREQQQALLYVTAETVVHLASVVPAGEMDDWVGGIAWAVRPYHGEMPGWLERRVTDYCMVFDTPSTSSIYWDGPCTAIVTDWGPWSPGSTPPTAYVCPHETAWSYQWPTDVPILGGAQYQPLRKPYWEPRHQVEEGTRWADPRTAHTDDDYWPTAEEAICMVGVRMYEAIAMGKRVAVVARNEAETTLAQAAGVPVMPSVEPAYSHLQNHVIALGAQNLATKLMGVMEV